MNGVTVEYRTPEGDVRGAQARVIDFDVAGHNDWLSVNQFSVTESKHSRRPDVVLFVNGLPLAVLELKNAADEGATIWTAFQQLQNYKTEIPALFAPNGVLVASDGVEARVGTLSAGRLVWHLLLFFVGSVAMRGAGCTYNDLVDHEIDNAVARTRSRPLPSGRVTRCGLPLRKGSNVVVPCVGTVMPLTRLSAS